MQALSIWPSKVDFSEVPKLEFQLGFDSFGRVIKRRKRKRLRIVDSIVHLRNSRFDLGFGCLSGHSRLKIYLYGERKSSLGMYFALGWALEEQAFGNNVGEENLGHIDTFSKGTQGNISIPLAEDDGLKSELPSSENRSSDDVRGEIREKEESGEEKRARVNVRGLAQLLQLAKSVDDVEAILKEKGELPLQVFSSIIRSFGREKRLEPAMAVVNWLKKKHEVTDKFYGPNLFIYNSLLGAVKQSGQLDKVEIVLNDMNEARIKPNIVTYNTLLGIFLDQGRPVEALRLFEDIQTQGLSPSPASYSTTLLAYRRMEDGYGALKFFVALREKYMKGELQKYDGEDWENEFLKLKNFTSRICYQVMRQWLVKDANLTTNVLKLLIEMDKADIPPTHAEYERLVWACTREEHCTVAKELYSRIRERYSDISLSICNHIIWLMGKGKKWWAALEIYEDLLDNGPKPNNLSYELIVSHFNVLLSAARKRGFWRWGVRLLNKMEAKGLKPGSREWNAVLVACSKASETGAAVEVFKKMVDRGEKPTIVSYGALLSAFEKGKLYDEAVRVWEHLLKVGVEPNIYAYTIMASVYVGLGKFHVVDYIIRDMVSTGNNPTVITFNAIISACSRNGFGGSAYEWFQRMKVMNIEPDVITYEMLIEALGKDGKPRLAYDLYLSALNEGLKPSLRAYDMVIQSSRTVGATIDVCALGPRPPEEKKKF